MADFKKIDLSDFDLDSNFINDESVHAINGGNDISNAVIGGANSATALTVSPTSLATTFATIALTATANVGATASCEGRCGGNPYQTGSSQSGTTSAGSWA